MVHALRPKTRHQSPLKIAAIFLIVVAVICFVGDPLHPSASYLRSEEVADVVSEDSQQESVKDDSVHEGRLFTFELGNLKGETTGSFMIRTRPSWAPLGVMQFHELVDSGFFDGCRFFRVLPNFVVQVGINGDPSVQSKWRKKIIKDDPVATTNSRGTLTFATSGPNTRTSQIFINTNKKGNAFLDKQGFSPFAEVISGIESVDLINDEYKEKPNQGMIQNKGNSYLLENFPNLSYIQHVKESSSR
mmetsp:Transcript_31801/g.46902  ORF Transcript_31801/g.46902 Transcript_31801/m.46902 type:complete len:246 (+) Transcript_31801:298-1035(+)